MPIMASDKDINQTVTPPSGGRIFIALSATALPNGNISITLRQLEFSNAVSASKRQIASVKGGGFDLAPGQTLFEQADTPGKNGQKESIFFVFRASKGIQS
jgi:hypothetical protein